MLIEEFDAFFEIPDSMIEKYCKEFRECAIENNAATIALLRDASFTMIAAMHNDPKKLDNPELVNGFIKAHAAREAMKKLGMLYNG